MPLTGREFPHVVSERGVEKCFGRGTAHEDFAHVADVEHARRATHRVMLVGDAGVLNRHLPAAELDELAAELLMPFKERSAF